MKDKIILVGDFNEDLHQTYVGDVPGPILSCLAYYDLHRGWHQLPLWLWGLLFLLYSASIYGIFIMEKPWYGYIPVLRKCKSRFARFVLSLLGAGVVLLILQVLLYVLAGFAFSIFIPSLFLAILSEHHTFLENEKMI